MNSGLLSGIGFGVVGLGLQRNVHSYIGSNEAKNIFPRGFKILDKEAFESDLISTAGDTVIASSENFSFFFEQESIDELAQIASRNFDQTVIVCYLRRQDRHIVSHHAEGARPDRKAEWEIWGHGHGPIPEYSSHQALYLDYDERMKKWEKSFGLESVSLRIYPHDNVSRIDSVGDFCGVLGIAEDDLIRPQKLNVSLDRAKARLGHIVNGNGISDNVARLIMSSTPGGIHRILPSKAQAKRLLSRYRVSNRNLNLRYCLTDFPDLFDEDFSDLPSEPQSGWSDEEFNRIVRSLSLTCAKAYSRTADISSSDLRDGALALKATNPGLSLKYAYAALGDFPEDAVLRKLILELASTSEIL